MSDQAKIVDRRAFLRTAATMLAALVAQDSLLGRVGASDNQKHPVAFRDRLEGPIFSFPTPYTSEYKIDFSAVRRMVETAVKGGVKVFMLTSGNNQYDRLEYAEIKDLTRLLVESVSGRGMIIGATGPWWTGKAIDYAQFGEAAGVDAVQVMMSPNADDDGHFEHFRAIASATKLPLSIQGQPSMDLMQRLLTINSVVGLKEEFTTDYTLPLYQKFGNRLSIYAGGTDARYLTYKPYGMRAYFSTFAPFAPKLTHRFWQASEDNDQTKAKEMVLRYEVPFFERWSQPFWRGTLEYFGVGKRYLRPPEPTFSNKQMGDVKAFYESLGLAPGAA